MADQSANLTGMLGQIGNTIGSMGQAYNPITQAASRPQGNMTDPEHLQRLAQWAASNGDSASASMYMQQARTLRDQAEQARKVEGQGVVAGLMTQVRENETAEGVDPFVRNATSRQLNAEMLAAAEQYGLDPTRFVGYGETVRDEAMIRAQRQAAIDATARANNERATLERLNNLYAAGDETALENALVTLENDGQSTLTREFREGLDRVAEAEAVRDEHARNRSEKANHNRPLTEEEEADAKRFGIKVEAYPSIGAARSKINEQRVTEARAGLASKNSKVIATGVVESMMPEILREIARDSESFDDFRFTPGDDGLTDYIREDLLENEAILKEIAAFVSAQGPEQGEQAAAQVRRLVIEHLKTRTGEDGFIEKMFGGGVQSDLRKLSAKTADDYL